MVKEEQKRQGVRVAVLEDGLVSLTREVASLREDLETGFDAVDRRFDAVDRRFDAIDQRFDALEKRIDERLTAILSALNRPSPGRA